jgi:3-keto-disaccharide hydrolase
MSGQGDAGWITLSGLENWNQVGGSNWVVVDGVVQADKRTAKEAGFLVSKNSYRDFQIRAEFWVSDDANSGIYMRCADPNKITDKTCYEANVYDQRPDPSFGTGASRISRKRHPCSRSGVGLPPTLVPLGEAFYMIIKSELWCSGIFVLQEKFADLALFTRARQSKR